MATVEQAKQVLQSLSGDDRKNFISQFNSIPSKRSRQLAVDRLVANFGGDKPGIARSTLGRQFTPQQTQQIISRRPDLLGSSLQRGQQELAQKAQTGPLGGGGISLPTALGTVGGLLQRGEAAVANPLLRAQRGELKGLGGLALRSSTGGIGGALAGLIPGIFELGEKGIGQILKEDLLHY